MNGEVELLFLERVGTRWRFKTQPHDRFEKLIDSLQFNSFFSFKSIYDATGTVGKVYEVSDNGMWFLCHLFSNYEEMAAKAGSGEPKTGYCVECGTPWHYTPFAPCPDCKGPVCGRCKTTHQKRHKEHVEEKVCSQCGVDSFNDLIECDICGELFCVGCLPLHKYTHARQESEERERQERERSYFSFDGFEDLFRRYQSFTYGGFGRQSTQGTSPNQTRYISKVARDAFDLLGLAYTADAAQIKKAFKAKALVTHPDRGGTHDAMVKLNEAKEIALKYAEK